MAWRIRPILILELSVSVILYMENIEAIITTRTMYACPSCARHHKIVQKGRTVRKKHIRR